MIALNAEHTARGCAGGGELPTATVSKLEAGAGVGACTAGNVPLIGDGYLFRKDQRQRPAAQGGGAGIGDRYIKLKESAACIGRRGRATVRGVGLPV
jgi:hypothetical protein